MGVSENSGTPKSSILIGFSIINHPFWGTPVVGNIQILGIPVRDMGYSTVGTGLFHCGIWGIPVRDMGYSAAGYGVIPLLDMRYSIWDMLLIGSDIEYIKLEDIHSYLDGSFPRLNTP